MNKVLKIVGITAASIVLLCFLALHFVAPGFILKRQRHYPSSTVTDLKIPFENVTINTTSGLKLEGAFVESRQQNSLGLLIFVHGIGAYKEAYLQEVDDFTALGYDCFIYDQRAHGESEGDYCTYGYYEKYDLLEIVQYFRGSGYSKPIGLWGRSLGGAVVLQTLPICNDVDFAIVESTFSDLRTIVYDYQKLWSGIGFHWSADYALSRAEKIAKFEAKEVKPAESALSITQPILVIHGTKDDRISIEYGRSIYDNIGSVNKQFIVVNGANHLNVAAVGGGKLRNQIIDFVGANSNQLNPKSEKTGSTKPRALPSHDSSSPPALTQSVKP